MQNFDERPIEKIIGYTFNDKNLLKGAFVHSSYANEHKELKSNERLEFLGDSVLSVIVTDYIFKHYKNNEGDMRLIRRLHQPILNGLCYLFLLLQNT